MSFGNTDDKASIYLDSFEAGCIMTFELGLEGWVIASQTDKGGKDILESKHVVSWAKSQML